MTSASATTRLSFVERLRDRSDTLAWTHFHRHYGELLQNYAIRLGAPRETAEDVAQEVEMYVFKAMQGFRHGKRKGCFRAYLRSAVVHALARRAKLQHLETSLDPNELARLAQTDSLQDQAWQREDYLHRIRCAMRVIAGEMAPQSIEAFRLYVVEGCPVADTASHLGIGEDSVYQAKSRVIKRLREHLARLDPDALR